MVQSIAMYKADTEGYFLMPADTEWFHFDVGFHQGIFTKQWLKRMPKSFVVGVEASTVLVSIFRTATLPTTLSLCDPIHMASGDQRVRRIQKYMCTIAKDHADRIALVHAAASNMEDGSVVSLFQPMAEDGHQLPEDTGTVLQDLYKDQRKDKNAGIRFPVYVGCC